MRIKTRAGPQQCFRLNVIRSNIEDSDKDVIVHLLEIFDRFHLVAQRENKLSLLPAFIQQVSFINYIT